MVLSFDEHSGFEGHVTTDLSVEFDANGGPVYDSVVDNNARQKQIDFDTSLNEPDNEFEDDDDNWWPQQF